MSNVWALQGTERQNAIIQEALDRCDFPFERLTKQPIPVEWADLSRYTQQMEEAAAAGSHLHVHEGGDTAHPVERRERVLGLAWYSGKVTMEVTLESDPELAAEVFLSEGAHMIDFFYMDDAMRAACWNAVHPTEQHIPEDANIEDGVDLGHGHGWFDVASYREWVGEEFMGMFVDAFSDVQVTIDFHHTFDVDTVEQVRHALLRTADPYFGLERSRVFHDSHRGFPAEVTFSTFMEAVNEGRIPCRVCKPI